MDFDGYKFLIRYRLFDVVSHADSEHEVHFDKRSTFSSQNLTIQPHFLTIFSLAWGKEYSQLNENTRKKRNAYFCSALNGGSNGV